MKLTPAHVRVLRRCLYEDRGYDSPCLIFKGALLSNGYGITHVGSQKARTRRQTYTHRVIYEHFYGAIPSGLQIDHLCRQRDCCEATHLEAVTQRENILRGSSLSASRARQTHCIRGHEFTPENTIHGNRNQRRCRTCSRTRYARERRRSLAARPESAGTTGMSDRPQPVPGSGGPHARTDHPKFEPSVQP